MKTRQYELWETDRETGKDYLIESGPLESLSPKTAERVSRGHDAWLRLQTATNQPQGADWADKPKHD